MAERKGDIAYRLLVQAAVWSALFWLIVAASLGVTVSLKFLNPNLLGGFYFASFGAMRSAHLNVAILGWAVTMAMGAFFYFAPIVSGRPLWGIPLAWAS